MKSNDSSLAVLPLEIEDREGPVWHTPELLPPWEPVPGFRPPQWAFEQGVLLMRGHARGVERREIGSRPLYRLPQDVTDWLFKHVDPPVSHGHFAVCIVKTGGVYAWPHATAP